MQAALLSVSHHLGALRDDESLPSLNDLLKDTCRQSYRRIDRFVQLALVGSAPCVQGGKLHADCGIYMGSTHGPLTSNIRVQEQMLRGRELPKPFNFVNTLGSIAGFYIADNLQLSGPSLFVSRYGRSLEAALEIALTDLAAGAVEQALVGVVEEAPLPLDNQRLRLRVDADVALGEGSHWMLLGPSAQSSPQRRVGLQRYTGAGELESYLASHVEASTAVCLGRCLGPNTARLVRRYFPEAVDAGHLPLPFHDSIEAAWFVDQLANGKAGGVLLVNGSDDGDRCLLHLGA
ncbi:MAG: beta-ketoacyl synthase N-terminal-like domain-containing protein [Gammaproteobacteria bacterium]